MIEEVITYIVPAPSSTQGSGRKRHDDPRQIDQREAGIMLRQHQRPMYHNRIDYPRVN